MKRSVWSGTPRLWKKMISGASNRFSDQAKQVILEAYDVAGKTAADTPVILGLGNSMPHVVVWDNFM
jgi:hypothetical protein